MTKQQSSEYEISRLQDVLSDNSKKFNVLKYGTYDEAQAMLASIRQDALNEEIDDESQLPQTSDTIYIAYVT